LRINGLTVNASSLRTSRDELLRLCQEALQSARARGPADPQASTQPTAGTDGLAMAYVMLGSERFATGAEVLAAIRRRIPEFAQGEEAAAGPPSSFLDTSGDHFTTLMFEPGANPLSDGESFIRAAWWWPDVRDDLARRKAFVVVSESLKLNAKAAYT